MRTRINFKDRFNGNEFSPALDEMTYDDSTISTCWNINKTLRFATAISIECEGIKEPVSTIHLSPSELLKLLELMDNYGERATLKKFQELGSDVNNLVTYIENGGDVPPPGEEDSTVDEPTQTVVHSQYHELGNVLVSTINNNPLDFFNPKLIDVLNDILDTPKAEFNPNLVFKPMVRVQVVDVELMEFLVEKYKQNPRKYLKTMLNIAIVDQSHYRQYAEFVEMFKTCEFFEAE